MEGEAGASPWQKEQYLSGFKGKTTLASISIQKRDREQILILDVAGEIDMFTSPRLRTEILAALEDERLPIALNLSDVPYLDSSGLATIIEGLQRSQKAGRQYALFGLTQHVRSIFEVAKLTSAFSIYHDEAATLQAMQGGDRSTQQERKP